MATELEEKSQVKAKFSRNLATVRDDLMELAGLSATAMEQSVKAVLTRDGDLARRVIVGDEAVNSLEEAIDRECEPDRPVSAGGRGFAQLMAVDHIIAELERIGDSATNIAEEVLTLRHLPAPAHPPQPGVYGPNRPGDGAAEPGSLFPEQFPPGAAGLPDGRRQLDALDQAIIQDLLREMTGAPEAILPGQCQINIVRNLERVGDHATNIAEQVVYMVEGQSVRHRCQG